MLSLFLVAHALAAEPHLVVIGGDVIPGVGTGDERRVVSIDLIGGHTHAIEALDLAPVFSLVDDHVNGLQATGALGVAGGAVRGAQLAGAVAVAGGTVDGLQASGAVNVAGGAVHGAQWAGALNVAGDLDGVQASGAVNVAGRVRGAQLSGAVNLGEDVDGAQIGVVNIASRSQDGLQLGVVNVAKEADGLSLGLVNIVPGGRLSMDGWVDEGGIFRVGLEHGGNHFQNLLALGASPDGTYAATLGMGGHMASRRFFLDIDGMSSQVWYQPDFHWRHTNVVNTLRAQVGWTPVAGLALVAGPSYNVSVTQCGRPRGPSVMTFDETGDVSVYGWPGFTAGVKIGRVGP